MLFENIVFVITFDAASDEEIVHLTFKHKMLLQYWQKKTKKNSNMKMIMVQSLRE